MARLDNFKLTALTCDYQVSRHCQNRLFSCIGDKKKSDWSFDNCTVRNEYERSILCKGSIQCRKTVIVVISKFSEIRKQLNAVSFDCFGKTPYYYMPLLWFYIRKSG